MAQAAAWLGIAPDHPFGLGSAPLRLLHRRPSRRGIPGRGRDRRQRARPDDRDRPAAARPGAPVHGRAAWMSSWPPATRAWAQVRAELTTLAVGRPVPARHRGPARARPSAVQPAAAVHGGRLRRLLRLRAARHQRRPDLPAGRRAADAELEAPADRLSRPGRHRRRLRHRRSAARAASPGRPGRRSRSSARAPGWTSRPSSASSSARTVTSASPFPVERFAEHVFGVCLVNDWSARDIQRWESVPLGPFLGKSFATTISPWVLPLAALEHARVRPPSPRRQADRLPHRDQPTGDWTSTSRSG